MFYYKTWQADGRKQINLKPALFFFCMVSLLQFIWYIWKHTFIFPDLIHNVLGHQWWRKNMLMIWLFCTYKTLRKETQVFQFRLRVPNIQFLKYQMNFLFFFILVRYKCINSIHTDSLFVTIFGVHLIHPSLILAEICVHDTYDSC